MQKIKERQNNIYLNSCNILPALSFTEKKELKEKIQSAIDKVEKVKG